MRIAGPCVLCAFFFFVTGCAPSYRAARNPAVRKCWDADSTENFTRAEMEAVFRAVETGGQDFGPCGEDSAKVLRVRPSESRIPKSANLSYYPLAVNLLFDGAAVGLTMGFNHAGWLWLSVPEFSPSAGLFFGFKNYPAKRFEPGEKSLSVEVDPWFRDPDEVRRELLARAPGELSRQLFTNLPPPRDPRHNRLSVDPFPLIFMERNDALILSGHYERLLPLNFSWQVSLGGYKTFNENTGGLATWAGPRWYVMPRAQHTGFYLGASLLSDVGQERAWANTDEFFGYRDIGVLAGAGVLLEQWHVFGDFGLQAGPGYAWIDPNSRYRSGASPLALAYWSVGYRF